MAETTLGMPVKDGAVRSINFFNGRLLTGGDLSREQEGRRQADRRLGTAIGPGIAWGLEVTADNLAEARVRIASGLGVTETGAALLLDTSPVVHLVAPAPADTAAVVGSGFGPCRGSATAGQPYVAGDGLYLLTLAPVTVADGQAPVLALDSVNTRCSTDSYLDAVQLRLQRIDGLDYDLQTGTNPSKLRSKVARAFIDGGQLERLFPRPEDRSEVPLAVVYMDDGAIVWIDMWSVRRRLVHRGAEADEGLGFGDGRRALGEARLAQFRDHVAGTPNALAQPAADSLLWLPPAGFLPTTPAATDWRRFLGSLAPAREVPLARADLPAVLAEALPGDPVDLASPGGGRMRIYAIADGGPLLFVRDSRNRRLAEQVWLDDTGTGLNADDVQAGMSLLLRGSPLQLVLRPGMDWPRAIAEAGGDSLVLYFQPGTYKTDRAIDISGRKRVHIQGPGATLLNLAGACALRLTKCDEVQVHDIAFEAQKSSGSGPLGALTLIDCTRAIVERVACSGLSEVKGPTVALMVGRSKELQGKVAARLVVRDCELRMGAAKTVLACTGLHTVQITANRLLGPASGMAAQGVLIVDNGPFVALRDNVVSNADTAFRLEAQKAPDKLLWVIQHNLGITCEAMLELDVPLTASKQVLESENRLVEADEG